jgi:hypothetical protein
VPGFPAITSGVTQVTGSKEADTLAWVESTLPPNGNAAYQTALETYVPKLSPSLNPEDRLAFEQMVEDNEYYYRNPTPEADNRSTAIKVDPQSPLLNNYCHHGDHQRPKGSPTPSSRSRCASNRIASSHYVDSPRYFPLAESRQP